MWLLILSKTFISLLAEELLREAYLARNKGDNMKPKRCRERDTKLHQNRQQTFNNLKIKIVTHDYRIRSTKLRLRLLLKTYTKGAMKTEFLLNTGILKIYSEPFQGL